MRRGIFDVALAPAARLWCVPILLFSLLVLLSAGPAFAQPTVTERALAESLFNEAKSLVDAGKLEEACDKFAASQKLEPSIGTQLHLAACKEAEGKVASAWLEYIEAERLAMRTNRRDRAKVARARIQVLEPQVPHVVIESTQPGVTLAMDGAVLPALAAGKKLPVDPGDHVVEATGRGKKPWSTRVAVPVGETVTVAVPALEDEAPAPIAPTPVVRPETPEEPRPSGTSGRRVAAYTAGAVGIAGVLFGAYVGALKLDRLSSAETGCAGNVCTQAALDRFEEARTQGVISTVAFGVGAVGIGVGAYLLFTEPTARTSALRIAPSVGPGAASVVAAGAF